MKQIEKLQAKARQRFGFCGSLIIHFILFVALAFSGVFAMQPPVADADTVVFFDAGGGGGGGGGYITTELAVDLSKTTQISILVGAGGVGAITDSSPRPDNWHEASDGGNTTVQLSSKIITASGGKKGESKLIGDSAPYVAAKGGAGNGSGGGGSLNLNENQAFASRGKNASGYIFNDTSLGIAGGGGGGGGGYINSSHSSIGANGGAPNGGTGTCQSTTNTNSNGKSFGGGGGGTDCKLDSAYGFGGAGGAGGVYLRFHFDAA